MLTRGFDFASDIFLSWLKLKSPVLRSAKSICSVDHVILTVGDVCYELVINAHTKTVRITGARKAVPDCRPQL